jgi:hypothetical protein
VTSKHLAGGVLYLAAIVIATALYVLEVPLKLLDRIGKAALLQSDDLLR